MEDVSHVDPLQRVLHHGPSRSRPVDKANEEQARQALEREVLRYYISILSLQPNCFTVFPSNKSCWLAGCRATLVQPCKSRDRPRQKLQQRDPGRICLNHVPCHPTVSVWVFFFPPDTYVTTISLCSPTKRPFGSEALPGAATPRQGGWLLGRTPPPVAAHRKAHHDRSDGAGDNPPCPLSGAPAIVLIMSSAR